MIPLNYLQSRLTGDTLEYTQASIARSVKSWCVRRQVHKKGPEKTMAQISDRTHVTPVILFQRASCQTSSFFCGYEKSNIFFRSHNCLAVCEMTISVPVIILHHG